jgi:hypothetical protein
MSYQNDLFEIPIEKKSSSPYLKYTLLFIGVVATSVFAVVLTGSAANARNSVTSFSKKSFSTYSGLTSDDKKTLFNDFMIKYSKSVSVFVVSRFQSFLCIFSIPRLQKRQNDSIILWHF